MIASIFRKTREYHDLKWVRREDETLATAPEQVEEEVRHFFSNWFKSRMPVEERWGSWNNMMTLDTKELDEEFQEMVTECYKEPMEEMQMKAEETKMWENILNKITIEELAAAIKKAKKETNSNNQTSKQSKIT